MECVPLRDPVRVRGRWSRLPRCLAQSSENRKIASLQIVPRKTKTVTNLGDLVDLTKGVLVRADDGQELHPARRRALGRTERVGWQDRHAQRGYSFFRPMLLRWIMPFQMGYRIS